MRNERRYFYPLLEEFCKEKEIGMIPLLREAGYYQLIYKYRTGVHYNPTMEGFMEICNALELSDEELTDLILRWRNKILEK